MDQKPFYQVKCVIFGILPSRVCGKLLFFSTQPDLRTLLSCGARQRFWALSFTNDSSGNYDFEV
jgi:hypothetical protein